MKFIKYLNIVFLNPIFYPATFFIAMLIASSNSIADCCCYASLSEGGFRSGCNDEELREQCKQAAYELADFADSFSETWAAVYFNRSLNQTKVGINSASLTAALEAGRPVLDCATGLFTTTLESEDSKYFCYSPQLLAECNKAKNGVKDYLNGIVPYLRQHTPASKDFIEEVNIRLLIANTLNVTCKTSMHLEETSQTDDSVCFPGDAEVLVKTDNEKATVVKMKQLNNYLGYEVQTGITSDGEPVFSPLLEIPHHDPDSKAAYSRLTTTEGLSITVSNRHLIWEHIEDTGEQQLSFAGNLRIGDNIMVNGVSQQIETIESSIKDGIYSPLTLDGNILVADNITRGGFHSSCYTYVNNKYFNAIFHSYIRLKTLLGQDDSVDAVKSATWLEQAIARLSLFLGSS